MGGSGEILYCIILQKEVGGWVGNLGFSNYVISECSLTRHQNHEKLAQKTGFCIFGAFAVVMSLSKCDFWNLWKFLDRHEKKNLEIFSFEIEKNLEKKSEKIFREKSKILIFSIEKPIFSLKHF